MLQRRVKELNIIGPGISHFGIQPTMTSMNASRILSIKGGHVFDLSSLNNAFNSGIMDCIDFDGYAIRMDYLDLPFLKKKLFNGQERSDYRFQGKELVIHIRGGDILSCAHPDYMPLPLGYYEWLIDITGLQPVFMGQIGDDEYSYILRQKFKSAIFLPKGSVIDDFRIIGSAKNIALSVSTFSWIAAYLSSFNENIYMPVLGLFNPNQRPDINLIPLSDTRYRLIGFPIYKFNPNLMHKEWLYGLDKSYSFMEIIKKHSPNR